MKATEHFAASHTFHKAASKEHANLADQCDEQGLGKMSRCHKNLSELHADHAEHLKAMHSDAAAAADKAAIDELAKARAELAPTQVRGSIPTNPNHHAVIRTGGAPLQEPNIDPEFEKDLGLGKFKHIDEVSLQ